MELDERLRWIEIRVASSLKPRAEELKRLFSNKENREVMFEFCNNDERRYLMIFTRNVAREGLIASFKAPHHLAEKAMFFCKTNHANKLLRDNIANDVGFCDCSRKPLKHLKRLVKDVYLPVLSIEHGGSVSADKLMDLLHRLVASLHVFDGNNEDKVALSLPCIEVLSEAAAFSGRRPAVIHVLETTVVNWIKQIKVALKLDPVAEITKYGGTFPGPLTEIEMWSGHLSRLNFINEQLRSPVAVNIVMNLEDANSTYGQSFHLVKKELTKAEAECHENLQYLRTLVPWFKKLHNANCPSSMLEVFPPLMHTLYLVWVHSRYYHEKNHFHRLMCMLSNEVVARAKSLVHHNVLDKLDESFQSLKDALRICASFRGCYLDKKDKADVLNQKKLLQTPNSSLEQSEMYKSKRGLPERGGRGSISARKQSAAQQMTEENMQMWTDSPWPARNHVVFGALNSFMERCNDVLELVQTTTHFKMLRLASEIGGAGGTNLNSLVEEIYAHFQEAIEKIREYNLDVLEVNEAHQFEKAFFAFRSVMRNLERRLADVLRQSFKQCPDTAAKLRLLEVFEGTSGRELVQENLFDICDRMLLSFTNSVKDVKHHFEEHVNDPPVHVHLPLIASKLMWLKGLKARVNEPMSKFRKLSISSFKGDKGWKLRDTYSDLVKDIERAEVKTISSWQNSIEEDLRTKLKEPLLIEVTNNEKNSAIIQVNLDPDLLALLKEVYYLADPPFSVRLPDPARLLLRSVNDSRLRTTAARLETIVSRYNAIDKNIQPNEVPLFERKLAKINELLEQGVHQYTWKTLESADFVEHLCSLVCEDVHKNLCVVQNNYREINNIVTSWSQDIYLDAFSSREKFRSYSIDELNVLHRETYNITEHSIVMGGHRIHGLLLSTFEAVQISRASPAWQNYIQCVSELVLEGLKESVLVSLKEMLHEVNCSTKENDSWAPVLTIRLELSGSQVVFHPKLDEDEATSSVQEYVESWIDEFLKRADMVKPFEPGLKTYHSLITDVEEIKELMSLIKNIVRNNGIECQNLLGTFRQYAFLWMQDVEQTFKEFLAGNIVAHPRDMSGAETLRSGASLTSQRAKRDKGTRSSSVHTPGAYSLDASGALGLSEKTFLNGNKLNLENETESTTVPSLDDFDKELEIFRASRDEIRGLQDWCNIGFTRVNMRPVKQVLQTYASKWMFTYTKYLSDQVSNILNDLDSFLKRIEPGVEAITGEERDITSFMRLMRIFNEINTQQAEMDSKFVAMKRSINLLEKYDQKLPDTTQKFYAAAPQKWNNLKMKVAQAKQRLGPRIQSEEKSVTAELDAFGKRCDLLVREFMASEAFKRKCLIYTAFNIMDIYEKRMKILENEAQDLIELQELLEKNIVNFSVLPQVESDLECLREVWNLFRSVQEQQNDCKRQRWLKLDTKLLQKMLDEQLQQVSSLPFRSHSWDVHIGMLDSIIDMQACLPIVEDLQKAALRPRHWKQLLRLAGENIHVVANDGLVKMSFGQFIEFGFHHQADEVRTIIQKATKDVAIESSLRTYEEVWLSKVFELKRYKKARVSSAAMLTGNQEVGASEIDSEGQGHAGHRGLSGRYSVTSYGSGGLSHKESKTRRTTPSLASGAFSQSLMNLTQDSGPLCLLTNCDPIFEELESHQVSLQSMLCGSAASSFTDEIHKWQKQLQTIEAVLTVWLEVQDKWVELEDIYASFEVRIALPHEANLFAAVNRDFRVLMKATERNTNVLQSCGRTRSLLSNSGRVNDLRKHQLPLSLITCISTWKNDIQAKLEKMQSNLHQCWKSLLALLERRQQKFPRFYFLSPEDVLHIVCNGHHPGLVNPYLSKVYENIIRLQYKNVHEDTISAYRVLGVVSKMEEMLDFREAVVCDSTIENWLREVEKSLKTGLRQQLTDVINKFGDTYWQSLNSADGDIEKTWMLETAAEIVLLVTNIDLSSNIERCLEKSSQEQWNCLKELSNQIKATIAATSRMLKTNDITSIPAKRIAINRSSLRSRGRSSRPSTRGENQSLYSADDSQRPVTQGVTPSLDSNENNASLPYQYEKLVNLIALLMHKRDIIHKLLSLLSKCSKDLTQSFEWLSQVKYEYFSEDASLSVKILDARFSYGMEYQGACSRIVLTPMTDKCFVSLAQAVKCHMVGMCVGPSGSGKNETIRDFARVCGQPYYPFTCATMMDKIFITGVFKGLALTGAWICFGKINVMEKSILSTVVQLIQGVMDSLKAQKSSLFVENEDVSLIPTAACFATMIPGGLLNDPYRRSFDYFSSLPSSLSELPSDLVRRLRSVSFSSPDTRIISEVFLTANGFTTASDLSQAMYRLQGLCETFIPCFGGVNRQVKDLPTCMAKGSGWSTLCVRKIINDAANNLYEYEFSETIQVGGDLEVIIIATSAEEVKTTDHSQESKSAEPGGTTPSTAEASRLQRLEERALVEAIRDTFLPGLSLSDIVIFATLIVDVFQTADAATIFQSSIEEKNSVLNESEQLSAGLPALSVPQSDEKDEPSAISFAMARLDLQPGVAFESKVAQLAQLVAAHKTVAVVGPSGCGKTECIKTVAAAHREMGRIVRRDIVCTGALESSELMGFYDPNTSEWKDGLVPRILRKHAQQLKTSELFSGMKPTPFAKWIHFDGIIDLIQGEAFDTMIQNSGTVVFQSGERIRIPAALEIIWEIENLEHVNPATICQIGLLCMVKEDIGWQLLVDKWISRKQDREAELLRSLCDRYIGPTLEFLSATTSVPPRPGVAPTKTKSKSLEHAVFTSEINMIETLIALVDASISHHSDLMAVEYENHFNFAAIWAFGGTLIQSHRVYFNQWWKNQWKDFIMLPGNGEVWNYFVSPDTHEFCSWNEALQPHVIPHGEGIPHNAYVHTVYNEGFSHLVGLLSEAGRPVMFVGEQGCGKTSIVRDKLNNQDDDVAEFHSLSIYCNQFTTSRTLWRSINNCLEWKHGRTYIPKGNKKLICLVDDLNLSKANNSGIQSSTELIRQLIDHGGVFEPETYQWREVQDVTYITTYNPQISTTVPKIGNRLLRHFSIFHVPYPSVDALEKVYYSLLKTHFLAPRQLTTISSVTKVMMDNIPAAGIDYMNDEVTISCDNTFKDVLARLVRTTIELQNELRVMYLPTAQRCHYVFTLTDLTMVFRNLCLSLREGCSNKDLLLFWRNECDWVYNRRLVDSVDRERYQQTFVNAVKKEFSSPEQVQIMLSDNVLFTNLVEVEDSGMAGTGESTTGGSDENVQLAYRPLYDVQKVKMVLSHGITEYNKDFPKIKLALYDDTIEAICRLVRVIQSPHECSHALIVSEGSPGATSSIVKLAAHLCGFSLCQINASNISGTPYTMLNFRNDLVTAYRRAGVKRERILLLLGENDVVNNDMMVHISEFLVSSSIAHLFSEEERTSAINSVRSDVTQAGLTYSKEVAWSFFLRTVKENLRMILSVSSPGSKFQQKCRDFPGLVNSISIMFFPHWSRENLISRASYLLRDMELFDIAGKENMAHLFASIHLSLSEQDPSEETSGFYGHITNTTFEKFVERFINLFKKRYISIREEYGRMTSALENISKAAELAGQRLKQLEHEKVVLDQKKESNLQLLSQIGQDKAIAEEQIKLITRQRQKIFHLQKALPKFKEAHERSVFKAAAVVSDVKRMLRVLDRNALGELRAIQKPDPEIEDILATIIIILKSPMSDLTWNKGAKRIMANLDRFCDDLAMFDDLDITENTLQVLDPYLVKPHFDHVYMNNRTENPALVMLVKWVSGVTKYHQMMLSKVKPLHVKVEETTKTVNEASGKLTILQNKLEDLEARLSSLAKAYEEASIDKCRQFKLTQKLNLQLERASYFENVLSRAREKWSQFLQTISNREAAIAGAVCMAAAFATYLGPYKHSFRRQMLTVHWPECLQERGVPLLLDDAPHVVTGTNSKEDFNEQKSELSQGEEMNQSKSASTVEEETCSSDGQGVLSNHLVKSFEDAHSSAESQSEDRQSNIEEGQLGDQYDDIEKTRPLSSGLMSLSSPKYDAYLLSLIKNLVGGHQVRQWLNLGMGMRVMENASISIASWQRPPFVIDPHGRGLELIRQMEKHEKVVEIDVGDGDVASLMHIEKAITSGNVLVLLNVNESVDSIFLPLIYRINTNTRDGVCHDLQSVNCGGRRLSCHPNFRLYLLTSSHTVSFTPEIASITTLVNFTLENESFAEEILSLSLSRVQPEISQESKKTMNALMENLVILEGLDSKIITRLSHRHGTNVWDDTELIADMVQCRSQITKRIENAVRHLDKVGQLKQKYAPLSHLVTVLFNAINSLSSLQHEYRFSIDYFLNLFDIALCKVIPSPEANAETEELVDEKHDVLSRDIMIQVVDEDGNATQHKWVDGDENSKAHEGRKVSVILPPEAELPTPGITCEGIADDVVCQLIDELTKMVFESLFRSIYSHHRLTFGTLLSSVIHQHTTHDTYFDKRIEFLITGGVVGTDRLSLADFDPTLLTPSWVPRDRWQSLLSLSTLPGPLEGLCTKVASDPKWLEWYNHDRPESVDLPGIDEEEHQENKMTESEQAQDRMTDFHGLLILRCLRPDRLTSAMKEYVGEILDNLQAEINLSLPEILKQIEHSIPILVLLPDNSFLEMSTESPAKAILQLAENENIACQHVIVASGHENTSDIALATAVRSDSWIIIENIHCASSVWLKQLYVRLERLRSQAEASSSPGRWRVFLTTKPSLSLPESLLYFAHPLAWDFVQMEASQVYADVHSFEDHLNVDLIFVLITSLTRISLITWETVKRGSLFVRTTIFRLCILHSLLIARQGFGTRAMIKEYPFGVYDLEHAINLCAHLCIDQEINNEKTITELCLSVIDIVYGGKMTEEQDHEYRKRLITRIFKVENESSLTVGEITFPLPPMNVEPGEYGQWLKEKLQIDGQENLALTAVQPDTSVKMESDEHCALSIVKDLGVLKFGSPAPELINMTTLRRNLEMCLERLPTLLNLDAKKSDPASVLLPSVLSQLQALSLASETSSVMSSRDENLPETMSYALQQECKWFNKILCYIRQSLYTLEECILRGSHALPSSVDDVVIPLQYGLVPANWLHVNWQPSSHSLDSWLEEFQKCHKQLESWIGKHYAPSQERELRFGRVTLDKIWLGGLVNPAALLSSLKHEKAASCECSIKDIALVSNIGKSSDWNEESSEGITLTGLYIEGGLWETNEGLVTSSTPLSRIPDIFVKAVYIRDSNKETEYVYDCPVYRNRSRRYSPFKLPLKCSGHPDDYLLKGVALIIDPGEIHGSWKLQHRISK